MQLSKYFTIEEMKRSTTADNHHIDNTPDDTALANLKILCSEVLDQAREDFGPMVVNSGYRCREVNKLVGGKANSYHLAGKAADIHVDDTTQGYTLCALLLRAELTDLVILEKRGRKVWVHVQWSDAPRHHLDIDKR